MKILPPHAEVAVLPFWTGDNKEVQGPQYQSLCQICIVLGIISIPLIYLCLGWITGATAIAFGIVAKYKIKKSQGTQAGGTMAMIGIVLGIIGVGAAVALLIYAALMTDPVVCRLPESLEIYLNEKGNN